MLEVVAHQVLALQVLVVLAVAEMVQQVVEQRVLLIQVVVVVGLAQLEILTEELAAQA
jgi:hypothetical protein